MPCGDRGRVDREGCASGMPEGDPTAASDLAALRAVFVASGDGRLTSADTTWSQFKVAVTEPDGTLSDHTLAALGIIEIDLTGDATQIELPDGSVITGQTAFTMNGQTRTVGELARAIHEVTATDEPIQSGPVNMRQSECISCVFI